MEKIPAQTGKRNLVLYPLAVDLIGLKHEASALICFGFKVQL
jgi:hypothetical protein